MPRNTLSRRTLLRGAARGVAVAVGLPVLDAMLDGNGRALASGEPLPRRFGEFFWGNGVVFDRWIPVGTGAAWQPSPLLAPLAKVKPYLSIVTGTVVYSPYGVPGHFGSLLAITSAAPGRAQGGLNYSYTAKSIDQVIADKIGGATRLRSLEVGVASTDASDADFGAVAKSISHNGPNSPNLPIFDPIALHGRVFAGSAAPGAGAGVAAVTIASRKSVLDVVAADLKALSPRLGASDRQRLDQHLQGILDLEKQLGAVTSNAPACVPPARPTSSYPAIDTQQVQWEPLAAAQIELTVLALACDLTRVFTFRFSPCNDFTVYPGFPTFKMDPNDTNKGTSMHALTHTEGGDQPGVQKCVTYSMSKLAALLERMMAVREGDGTLLDNSAVLAFTECSEGRTHNATDQPGIPIIIAGHAGGALVNPGIHYHSPRTGDAPGEDRGRNVSTVALTLMQALGTGITSWGVGAGQATRPIVELLV